MAPLAQHAMLFVVLTRDDPTTMRSSLEWVHRRSHQPIACRHG